MNAKEKIRNDVLVCMRLHLNREQMSILDEVLVKVLQDVEVTEQLNVICRRLKSFCCLSKSH